ncbi:CLUMA_CG015400, isoform A [Clunio marinus]|uniref:CLUMA_CG015400, isoform A n=1 Tax=Clunio marinus TaxID=568069 RepID=A0A1J1IPQ6_9DIPT|nr:CLUMA_CG015400, isoform A [Clunio marinus]
MEAGIFLFHYLAVTEDTIDLMLATASMKTEEIQQFIDNLQFDAFENLEIENVFETPSSFADETSVGVFITNIAGFYFLSWKTEILNIIDELFKNTLSEEEYAAFNGMKLPFGFPLSCIETNAENYIARIESATEEFNWMKNSVRSSARANY